MIKILLGFIDIFNSSALNKLGYVFSFSLLTIRIEIVIKQSSYYKRLNNQKEFDISILFAFCSVR